MANLNLDLSQFNPVQNESQWANVPVPSAHLVMITEDEIKTYKDDNGFDKSTRVNLHCEILHSSCGTDYVGQKLNLSCAISGEEVPVLIGMKNLSTLSHTLGLGHQVNDTGVFYNQPFIVIVDRDKEKNTSFLNFKKILRSDGFEIASANGEFREMVTINTQYTIELTKLLEAMNGGNQTAQAPQQGFAPQQQGFAPQQQQAPAFAQPAQQAPVNSFVPQNGQAPTFAQSAPAQQAPTGFAPQQQAQQQAPAFGQQPAQPQWGATINQSNGQ